MMHSLSRALRVKCSTSWAQFFVAEVAIGHRDASSRMFQASCAWSSVVACCRNMWRGDLPKLGNLQSKEFLLMFVLLPMESKFK